MHPQETLEASYDQKGTCRMIIEPMNPVHLVTITLIPLLLYVGLFYWLRNYDDEKKRRILLYICYFNNVLYIVYKIVQFYLPSYDFDIWLNLPLHFCNINLILLPLALLLRNKYLLAYQFYFGVSLSLLALLAVDEAFRGQPILEFTALVYFYYHSFLMIAPILLVKFKFFTPSFKAVWQPTLILIGLTLMAHIVNMVFRNTGLASEANYFFTYGLHGDPLTDMYWRLIPYEFFFLLPSLLSFAPFIILTTLPFWLRERKERRREELRLLTQEHVGANETLDIPYKNGDGWTAHVMEKYDVLS